MVKVFYVYGAYVFGMVLANEVLPTNTGVAVGGVVSLGFAVWYGWYVTTKVIPKMAEEGRQTIVALEDAHERQMARMAETFQATVQMLINKEELP